MSPRGAKPKPAALRLVKDGERPAGALPATLEGARIPSPPVWLVPEAKVEWARLGPRLRDAGLLSAIDRTAFAAYCQAYGTWAAAEKALAELRKVDNDPMAGHVTKTKGGGLTYHPLAVVASKARAEAVKIAAEFGLTPSSRARFDTSAAKNRAKDGGKGDYFDD